jgi:hypothetical protein
MWIHNLTIDKEIKNQVLPEKWLRRREVEKMPLAKSRNKRVHRDLLITHNHKT